MKVKQLLSEKREALEELGNADEMLDAEKRAEMAMILDKFAKAYKAQTDGQGRTEMVTDRLTGGARIDYICGATLKRGLEMLRPLDGMSDLETIIAIRNAVGIGMRLFQPEVGHVITIPTH